MHDSVHSLARSLSETTYLSSDNGSSIDMTPIHHANVFGSACGNSIVKLKDTDGRNMRSLFSEFDALFFVKKFRRLRILSFACSGINELPNSIGKLKHLRYFDILGTRIRALPDSFTKLYNLETFKAERCRYLQKLPDRMGNLVELSHLHIEKIEVLVPINIGRLTCVQKLQLFVVGVQEGRSISELGSLGQLQGRLELHKLELVRNQEEAMAAKLKDKKQIHELVLRWTEGTELVEQFELVLESLQPHTNLEGLRFEGYSGGKLPSWLSTADRNPQTLLANLTSLRLSDCFNCVRLPSLGHLDKLTNLEIRRLPKVKSIGTEFYLDGNFPVLKILKLSDMESLEEWMWTTKLDPFPSLEDLTITHCEKLKGIPLMNGLPGLERFVIVGCKELRCIGDGLSTCMRLKQLEIDRCDDLKVLPSLRRLSSLQRLSLIRCSDMTSGLEYLPCLTSLVDLTIDGCPNTLWDGIPEQSWSCLTALKRLVISGCDSMHQYIPTSLETLVLKGSPNWKMLPPQIQQLTILKELEIGGFGMEALPEWFRNLSSIQRLSVIDCPNLMRLPSRESILHLSNLEKLLIFRCPKLEERCDIARSGPEWSKISHIPIIQIDFQTIKT